MRRAIVAAAVVACGGLGGTVAAEAAYEGLYAPRTTYTAAHAPRHGGPNEDSYLIRRDDRGVIACYKATYYPAEYRVDPQGVRVSGSNRQFEAHGQHYVLRRNPPVYLKTRTRVKEDYVSLDRVPCR